MDIKVIDLITLEDQGNALTYFSNIIKEYRKAYTDDKEAMIPIINLLKDLKKGAVTVLDKTPTQRLNPYGNSKFTITDKFSKARVNPVSGVTKPHTGIDLYSGSRDIYTVGEGIVIDTFKGPSGYGNYVDIRHSTLLGLNDVVSRYAHLSKILVNIGDSVTIGSKIGVQGATGNVTGEHLHFELRVGNKAIDPEPYLVRF